MKILVVSGFLGAGKTTFIETLTQKINGKPAILENEYGEVGIDGDLLKKEDLNIWELTEGCICCSMKANFAESILTIANTVEPEVLIIEPTGVGLLSAVMENIKKVEYERISILEPVTIVDPLCVERYIDEFEEIFVNQIQSSKMIILSKISLVTRDDISHAVEKIKELNPTANICTEDYLQCDEQWWDEIIETKWHEKLLKGDDSVTSQIENVGFTDVEFDDMYKFESYMSAVMNGRFGNIIRAKGFLPINGKWGKVDIVNKQYTLTPIDDMEESKLILIGTNIDRESLEKLF